MAILHLPIFLLQQLSSSSQHNSSSFHQTQSPNFYLIIFFPLSHLLFQEHNTTQLTPHNKNKNNNNPHQHNSLTFPLKSRNTNPAIQMLISSQFTATTTTHSNNTQQQQISLKKLAAAAVKQLSNKIRVWVGSPANNHCRHRLQQHQHNKNRENNGFYVDDLGKT
ncbi:hypothetical protein MTR_6g016160 [Medicago truncatula]|uniref:Transmembrane protein n=1 Tax=Medicago truncatula TaxID=3880 RepID=A0A072U601_MEDTR|nr:hypothetical protein MTR_6g016160 [Medicago truncatula]